MEPLSLLRIDLRENYLVAIGVMEVRLAPTSVDDFNLARFYLLLRKCGKSII
jgi:hypothetical protein